MKNIIGVLVLMVILSSCSKDSTSTDYTLVDAEKANLKSTLTLSNAFNDTLIMVYDTVKIQKNNHFCLKYDSLYHKNDSLFNVHYMMFGNEMYKNGMMMSNFSPSNSMMQGGMMGSSNMDATRMMNDTTIVGGYYRTMHQLHTQHIVYHNGIHN